MLLEKMSWFDVEKYLKKSDKIVIPIGSIEQHAYLSLLTDSLIPGKIAKIATEELNILLAPTLHYGVSNWASAYPGTISLSSTTYLLVIKDIVKSLIISGFKKIVFLNGHGSNSFAGESIIDALSDDYLDDISVFMYEWYKMKETRSLLESISPDICHGNWAENFKFTRINTLPDNKKDKVELETFFIAPKKRKKILGDGSMGGAYSVDDELMDNVFNTAVKEFIKILKSI